MAKIVCNEFGIMMMENRPIMDSLDLDLLTRDERTNYLTICDNIARTAFAYISNNDPENFPAFRSALHALFTFVGAETRILSLDAYSLRFIPATVQIRVNKSKEYKQTEKNIYAFKKAMKWAYSVSETDGENDDAVIFPKAVDIASAQALYYNAEVEDLYNAIIRLFTANECTLTVADLKAHLTHLEAIRDELGEKPWQCYKDYKNPMKSVGGKELRHIPESIRKNIEDAMAELLEQRELMTEEQLAKEDAQIAGGKKQSKQAKASK